MTPSDAFLALLDPDRATAEGRLEELRQHLLSYFRWRKCPEPEALASETLTRGFAAVASGTTITTTLQKFIWGIARNILLESRRAGWHTRTVALTEAVTPATETVRAVDAQLDLEACLRLLDPASRSVFVHYHAADTATDRRALAAALGLSEGALRIKVHRLRQRLLSRLSRRQSPERLK